MMQHTCYGTLRVVLAKMKELHEHYFGSLFVNNFPCFQNQIQCRSDGWAEIIVLISRQHSFLKANKLPPLPCNTISSSFGAPKYDTDMTLVCEDV